jgi:hypothetical protein
MPMLKTMPLDVPDAQSKIPYTWYVVIAANLTAVNQSDFTLGRSGDQ